MIRIPPLLRRDFVASPAVEKIRIDRPLRLSESHLLM